VNAWLFAQRKLALEGSVIEKARDDSLKRWKASTRYPDDRQVPINNNWVENQMCPWAIVGTGCSPAYYEWTSALRPHRWHPRAHWLAQSVKYGFSGRAY
jgi:hypothetical protein